MQRLHALVQVLPVARDDEQGVVDPDAQPDHRRQDRGELRHGRERRQDQGEAGPRGEADHGRRDRQSHRDHGAERDQQDDHRGQQADQLGRARLGLRPPRGVLAADLRLQVGGADVVERRLERLERLDAQVEGRLVVGDLRVADRAVGREGARGLERIRDRDHVRLTRDRVQRGGHGVGLVLERPVGRVEDDVGRGAGGGGVALSQQVVGALRLGVRQVEVVGERAAEGAGDHEDRDHGGDPDAEGAPTVARCRLTEPIQERTQGMNLSSGGGDARQRTGMKEGQPERQSSSATPSVGGRAESSLSIRAPREPSDAAAGTTSCNHRANEEVDMASERSGYGRKWKRWFAID